MIAHWSAPDRRSSESWNRISFPSSFASFAPSRETNFLFLSREGAKNAKKK